MPVKTSVALNRPQAGAYLSSDSLHVFRRPVLNTLLELGNDGGAEVNRECVRAGKMIATQTSPSQGGAGVYRAVGESGLRFFARSLIGIARGPSPLARG